MSVSVPNEIHTIRKLDDVAYPDRLVLSIPNFGYGYRLEFAKGKKMHEQYGLPDSDEVKLYDQRYRDTSAICNHSEWATKALDVYNYQKGLTFTRNDQPKRLTMRDAKVSDTPMAGEKATVSVLNRLGIGRSRKVNLNYSGFWIEQSKSDSLSESALYETFLQNKIEVGYQTGGLGYDISEAITVELLLNHILESTRHSTLQGVEIKDLGKYIRFRDFRRMVVAQLVADNPRGIEYTLPCMANPHECRHTTHGIINPDLMMVEADDLNEQQLNFMVRAYSNGTDPNSLDKFYELSDKTPVSYTIRGTADDQDVVQIKFADPMVAELVADYKAAISHVSRALPKSLKEASATRRNNYLTRQINRLALLNYVAWIDEITIGIEGTDGYRVYNDRETIRSLAIKFSTEEDMVDNFTEALTAFMTTYETIQFGVTPIPCELCGKLPTLSDDSDEAVEFIPLFPETVFLMALQYTLAAQGAVEHYVF